MHRLSRLAECQRMPGRLGLLRGCERVLLHGGFGERLVVGGKVNRVDAIAFSIAVKQIAFAQFEFSFYSA